MVRGDEIDINGFSIGDSRSLTISFEAGCQLTPEHKTSAYCDYKLACWQRKVMSHFSRTEYSVVLNRGASARTEYEEGFSLSGNKLDRAARWRNATQKVEYTTLVSRALAKNSYHQHSEVTNADISTELDTQ